MCTLTYIPLKSGRVITANRDERPLRTAKNLTSYETSKGSTFHIAREPLHGGTNFATSLSGKTAVLLNGAFKAHEKKESNGMSRGLVLLQSLEYPDLAEFTKSFDFAEIEPFTLINFGEALEVCRWDGGDIQLSTEDTCIPHIWASAQLYSKKARENRKEWFSIFLETETIDAHTIRKFHFEAGDGDPENDLVMNRQGMVRTVSISQSWLDAAKHEVRHYDLLNGQVQKLSLYI